MANTRQYVKTYKGWDITKINGYKYNGYNKEKDKGVFAYSLKDLCKLIDKEVGYV